eukprot:scaffold126922_cov73-Phaeocystis_antarctica.AAC.1
MNAHARSPPGTPSDDSTSATPMAFANHILSVDAAFHKFGADEDENSILHACKVAAHVFSVSMVSTSDLGDIPIPKGYKQAITGPLAEYWQEAIVKELAGL